ncbi:hypothetical protein [Escherichia coli]|uniref:hypothetical protein n=1 Tax=Escherichia coli TaxID=562 RepID=UPI0022260A00|nr:hypothetical protein [Escherichia coli]MCW3235032.1 hypothetical protein [Escherichia coli]
MDLNARAVLSAQVSSVPMFFQAAGLVIKTFVAASFAACNALGFISGTRCN